MRFKIGETAVKGPAFVHCILAKKIDELRTVCTAIEQRIDRGLEAALLQAEKPLAEVSLKTSVLLPVVGYSITEPLQVQFRGRDRRCKGVVGRRDDPFACPHTRFQAPLRNEGRKRQEFGCWGLNQTILDWGGTGCLTNGEEPPWNMYMEAGPIS